MSGYRCTSLPWATTAMVSFLSASAGAFAEEDQRRRPVPKTLPVEATAVTPPIDAIFGTRLVTDYNFRGVSQSNRKPAAQGYVELQFLDNIAYTGFTAYKVDLPTRPSFEGDVTAGVRPKFGPLQFDIGFIYYSYAGERTLVDLSTRNFFTVKDTDFIEFSGKAAYPYGDELTFGAYVYHTGNYLGTHANATYVSATAKYTIPAGSFGFIPPGFAISGEFGHYTLGRTNTNYYVDFKLPSYLYGNIGLSYTYENVTLDLRYHDTDLTKTECFALTSDPRGIVAGNGRSSWCSEAIVGTLSFDFQGSKLPGIFAPAAR